MRARRKSADFSAVEGCGRRHHLSLHQEADNSQQTEAGGRAQVCQGDDPSEEEDEEADSADEHAFAVRPTGAYTLQTQSSFVSLAFLPVEVENPETGLKLEATAMLDLGADGCLIHADLAAALGCMAWGTIYNNFPIPCLHRSMSEERARTRFVSLR